MAEIRRLRKPAAAPEIAPAREASRSPAATMSGWAAAPGGAPFALGGLQRQVVIGRANDPFEREAEHVAQGVASGSSVTPSSISSLATGSLQAPAQRATTTTPEKKEQKTAPPPSGSVQRLGRPEEEKKELAATVGGRPVQRVSVTAPEKRKEEKPAPGAPVQRAAVSAPEKKDERPPVQRAVPVLGEQTPVQRQADEEEPLQTLAVQPSGTEAEGAVQADGESGDAAGAAAAPAMENAAAHAIATKGPGEPLHPGTQHALESRMGADLSDVRVHSDSAAHDSARALNARAFTHGHDIWLGRGESPSNVALMAHEATHVVQQGHGVHRSLIQRADNPPAGGPPAGGPPAPTGGPEDPKIVIPKLPLPPFKNTDYRGLKYQRPPASPLYRRRSYARGNPNQAAKWDREVNHGGIKDKLAGPPFNMRPDGTYMLRVPGEPRFDRIGNAETIAPGLKRPFWRRDGAFEEHHVDHIVELQVAGWPRDQWANELENMEMLNASGNTSSGSQIATGIEGAIQSFLKDPTQSAAIKAPADRDVAAIKRKYDVVFQGTESSLRNPPIISAYTRDDVEKGTHIDVLARPRPDVKLYDLKNPHPAADGPYSSHSLATPEVIGSETSFVIYRKAYGGRAFSLRWTTNETERAKTGGDPPLWGLNYTTIGFDRHKAGVFGPDIVGFLRGSVFKRQRDTGRIVASTESFPWNIRRVPGTDYAGYLDADAMRAFIQGKLSLSGLSPIRIDDVSVDDTQGLVAVGKIAPTIPIFRELDLDIVLEGDDLRVEKTFATGDFRLPGPIKFTDSSLTLSIGTESGFGVRGRVDFLIERLGTGFLEGRESTGRGFAVHGEFNFDSRLFDPAHIGLHYEDGVFSGEGHLGIKENKVRGIRSADIRASYREGRFEATGTARLSVPGVREGSLSLTYSEAEGFTISGVFQLADNIPGIRGGSVEARVERRPEAEGYKVSARGTAEPKIPGITATVTVAYDDGAFTIEGTAAYEKGFLHGSVQIGVTNRPLGADGQPSGPPVEHGGALHAYGGGTVTVRIAPWLQGTVGLRLLPNGDLVISGAIGLPAALEIFPEKALNKNIFSINIDIPILGFAVAGQRVGIFLTIGGGLDVNAGIGPGQLRELGLAITYNPAHEEQTHVSGGAQLFIPAHAGLRLNVHAALGAGIPIVSAQAGLEIGGQLGVEGAIVAGVHVDWTPVRGLVLDAAAEIFAEPKLKFDVTGFVKVEANLLITTINLYERRWELAALELGSGLRFGIRFPIHYEEGKPFDVSLSDVQFEVPHVEPREVLENLLHQIV